MLNQKIAWVSGANRGLGEALVDRLVKDGWDVTTIGRSPHPRLGAAKNITADLSRLDPALPAIEESFQKAAKAGAARAIFIHNAATAEPLTRITTLTPDQTRRSFEINLISSMLLTTAFARAFDVKGAPPTRLIQISSGAAINPIGGSAVYSAAKAGMENLTKCLHAERVSESFETVAFRPGVIDTGMQSDLRNAPIEKFPSKARFTELQATGKLRSAEAVAAVLTERLIDQPVESSRAYLIQEFLS